MVGAGGRGLKRRRLRPIPRLLLHPLETGRSGRQGVARHDGLTLGTTAPRQPPRGCTGGWFGTELTQHTRSLAHKRAPIHPLCQCVLAAVRTQAFSISTAILHSLVCICLFLSVCERASASLHIHVPVCVLKRFLLNPATPQRTPLAFGVATPLPLFFSDSA